MNRKADYIKSSCGEGFYAAYRVGEGRTPIDRTIFDSKEAALQDAQFYLERIKRKKPKNELFIGVIPLLFSAVSLSTYAVYDHLGIERYNLAFFVISLFFITVFAVALYLHRIKAG